VGLQIFASQKVPETPSGRAAACIKQESQSSKSTNSVLLCSDSSPPTEVPYRFWEFLRSEHGLDAKNISQHGC